MTDLTARIKPKKSSTAGEVPQAADLEVAEIAVNTADGKLFVKHTDNSIKEVSGGGATGVTPSSPVPNQATNTLLLDVSQYSGTTLVSVDSNTTTWNMQSSGAFVTSWAKFPGGAMDFTANKGYLQVASGATLNETFAGDLTVACWINKTGTTYGPIFDFRTTAGTDLIHLWCNANGAFVGRIGQQADGNATTAVIADGEHHVALVRSGQVITLYVDGTSAASYDAGLVRSVPLDSGTNKSIGAYAGDPNTYNFTGQIADVVVNNGTAIWTSNFTAPDNNVAYAQSSGVVVLPSGSIGDLAYNTVDAEYYHATSTSSWNRFASYPATSSPADGQVLTWVDANSQWEPADAASGAVDSVNGQTGVVGLGIQDMNDYGLNDVPFPYNYNSTCCGVPDGDFSYSGNVLVLSGRDADGTSHVAHMTATQGQTISVWYAVGPTVTEIPGLSVGWINSASGQEVWRLEGTLPGDITSATGFFFEAPQTLNDGQVLTWVDANSRWEPADATGTVQSVAGKTGAVTLELTDNTNVGLSTAAPTLPANTIVALTGEGVNGATTFANSATANSGDGTAVGDAQISNAQSKFYGTSIALDGIGDAVVIAHDDEQNLGGNDFTVQFWVRFNALANGATYAFCDKSAANTSDVGWRFWYSHSTTGNSNFWYTRSSNGFSLSNEQFVYTSNRLAVDTWHHIRLCQSGGIALCFVDGIHVGSSNPTSAFEWASSADLRIGAQYTTTSNPINAYLNDFQIINGTALSTSTASFTPPTTGIGAPVEVAPSDGQVLTWVDANSRWEPADATGTVASVNGQTGVVVLGLDDLDDVTGTIAATISDTWSAATPANGFDGINGGSRPTGTGQWAYYDGELRLYQNADSTTPTFPVGTGAGTLWLSIDRSNVQQIAYSAHRFFSADGWWGFTLTDPGFAAGQSLGVAFSDPGQSPPTDGQVLTWVAANSRWEPANLGGAAVRAALGIGEYADDAAAGTGGVASGAMYYNTTSSDYRLKS